MSRVYDAKQHTLKAYPNDMDAGVDLFLDFCDIGEEDFKYEYSMSPKKYIYGEDPQPVLTEEGKIHNFVLYIGGNERSYHCEVCGANVFHKYDDTQLNKYKCNGCGETYTAGE